MSTVAEPRVRKKTPKAPPAVAKTNPLLIGAIVGLVVLLLLAVAGGAGLAFLPRTAESLTSTTPNNKEDKVEGIVKAVKEDVQEMAKKEIKPGVLGGGPQVMKVPGGTVIVIPDPPAKEPEKKLPDAPPEVFPPLPPAVLESGSEEPFRPSPKIGSKVKDLPAPAPQK